MKDIEQLEKILWDIVCSFTAQSPLKMTCVDSYRATNISLLAHADDVPKLIGSGGVMIDALRIVSERMGKAIRTHVHLSVMEPKEGERMRRDPFKANHEYKVDQEKELLKQIGEFIFDGPAEVYAVDTDPESAILTLTVQARLEDGTLEHALSTVFMAIGRSNGKNLRVEVCLI